MTLNKDERRSFICNKTGVKPCKDVCSVLSIAYQPNKLQFLSILLMGFNCQNIRGLVLIVPFKP